MKILCGDQVYLDAPFYRFAITHTADELSQMHFANYVETWRQEGGYRDFLQRGANFFMPDDHEFWNNSPNAASFVRDSWRESGRSDWRNISDQLLAIFQQNVIWQGLDVPTFKVDPVSFFMLDTRTKRLPGKTDFSLDSTLQQLERWIDHDSSRLRVLVIGQPIFSEAAGWFSSTFADKNLPNYRQYSRLARIIASSKKPMLILTGDVHYGRISHCWLQSNQPIYELISSPTSLVSGLAGGKWDAPPDMFPNDPVDGIVRKDIFVADDYQIYDNHMMLISFFIEGSRVGVQVKSVAIPSAGQSIEIKLIRDLRL